MNKVSIRPITPGRRIDPSNPVLPFTNPVTTGELPATPEQAKGRTFAELAQSITISHARKNDNYGNAFSPFFRKEEALRKGSGVAYAVSRISEKAHRAEILSRGKGRVKDEPLIDTLLDIATYCLMTVEEMELSRNEK